MSVQIPLFTEDVNIISSLPDQPTITSTELKAKFDEASTKIKNYINNTLIDGITDWGDDLQTTIEGDLQDALDEIQALIDGLSAEDVAYDNTTSGLTATDVQNAIDELVTKVNSVTSDVNNNLGKKTIYSDFEMSNASASVTVQPLQDYTGTIIATKSGFKPLGIVGVHFTRVFADMQLVRWQLTSRSDGSTTVTYRILNADNTRALNASVYFDILWVKVR